MAAIDAFKNEKKAQMTATVLTQHYAGLLALFTVVSALVFCLSFFISKDGEDIQNAVAGWVAQFRAEALMHDPSSEMNYYEQDQKRRFAIGSYAAIKTIQEAQQAVSDYFIWSVILALAGGLAAVLIFIKFGFGSSFMTSDGEGFLRGGKLVSEKEMRGVTEKIIAKQNWEHSPQNYPLLQLGTIRIPIEYEKKHALFSGDTGSGKSQQLMSFIQTIVERDAKAIIWDKSGELTQHFFREGIDIMLGPFDARCSGWMPSDEAREIYELESLAASYIPISGAEDQSKAHWAEAARTLFVWVMKKLDARFGRQITVDHILKVFMEGKATVEENALGEEVIVQHRAIDKLIKGTLASMTVSPDNPTHAADVISTLVPKIRALYYMRGLENKEHFSIKEWARNEDDRRRIFIRVDGEQLRSVKPLVTAWMDIAVNAILSLPKSPKREVWCFLDELQSLDKLTALEEGINEGRKFGLRFVLGFTSVGKLNDTYGKESMKAIISGCGIKSIYRFSDADTAEWASRLLVGKEVITDRSSANFGTRNDNAGVSEQREKLALVSADELITLDDLSFYARLPGSLPTTKVDLVYRDYPIKTKHFIPRRLPPDIDYSNADHLSIFDWEEESNSDSQDADAFNQQARDPLL